MEIKTTNTILYCKKWNETVNFYKKILKFPISFSCEWFVEFTVNETSRISIANEDRSSIKSSNGAGITIAFEVECIEKTHTFLQKAGFEPNPIFQHPWDANVFHLFDPEGNRVEFWSKATKNNAIPNE